jgi:hypothetical protein
MATGAVAVMHHVDVGVAPRRSSVADATKASVDPVAIPVRNPTLVQSACLRG